MEAGGHDFKTLISSYISQYRGMSRYIRLLRLAETSQDAIFANEALSQCI